MASQFSPHQPNGFLCHIHTPAHRVATHPTIHPQTLDLGGLSAALHSKMDFHVRSYNKLIVRFLRSLRTRRNALRHAFLLVARNRDGTILSYSFGGCLRQEHERYELTSLPKNAQCGGLSAPSPRINLSDREAFIIDDLFTRKRAIHRS
jgi:hypothetical protein